MGMLFCLQPKSSGGTRHSRMAGRALRMNSAQGVLQLQELENIVACVKDVLDRDRCLNVWLIAEEVGLPKMDVHRIITEDLHVRKICAKLVPKNLSDEQKDNRALVSRELLDRVTSEPDFLQRVITGDETWVFEYDPTTKRRSSEWHTSQSPRPKKARMSKSRVKSMLIIFF